MSERWQEEIAETVFDYINQETDKIEAKRKAKLNEEMQEEMCKCDCVVMSLESETETTGVCSFLVSGEIYFSCVLNLLLILRMPFERLRQCGVSRGEGQEVKLEMYGAPLPFSAPSSALDLQEGEHAPPEPMDDIA